jgi:hypothetical protein
MKDVRCFLVVTALAALAALAACFDPSVPNHATLLCRSDAECAPPESSCDLASHTCAKPGQAAPHGPHVAHASFTPSSARDGAVVTLAIDADAEVSATIAPVLAFADDGAPRFQAVSGASSTTAQMSASIDASIAEGFYVLDTITLTSADGNASATTPVDGVSFKVDRTPPAISNLRVAAADGGGVVSDQTGTNAVDVTFAVDEPVDASGLSCLVGTVPIVCTIGTGFAVSCTGDIAPGGSGVVNGENVVLVTATDAAGNQSTASTQIAVDLSPPSIVPGSVVVDVDGSSDAPFATVGSAIDVQLLFDESLASDPVVKLTSGEAFAVVDNIGAFYRLHAIVADVAVDGTVGITAASTDRFGHSGTEDVPLPSPFQNGIPVQKTVTSPCTIPPNASGSTCTDFDGDGFFGPSPGCTPNPVDCDDRDPLTYPGAPEIPGDGKRNDCTNAPDAPLDGMHIDAIHGDDVTGDGSATRPYQTLAQAIAVAGNLGLETTLLLAPGTYPIADTNTTIPFDIVGGLDPVTWLRGAGESRVFVSGTGLDCGADVNFGGAVIDGVSFSQSLQTFTGPASLVDVLVDGCGMTVNQSTVMLRVHAVGAQIDTKAPDVAIIESVFGAVAAHAAGTLLLRSTVTNELFVDGAVDVVDSVVVSDPNNGDPAVLCSSCTAVGIYYSNILGQTGGGALGVAGAQQSDIRIISSQLAASSNNTLVDLGSGSLVMFDDVIDQPGGTTLTTPTTTITSDTGGLAQLNACGFAGCTAAGGNFFGTISTQGDQLHDGNAPAGVNYGDDVFHLGSPTSIAGDIDGQCRFADGHDDVGPDELVP